MSKRKRFLNQDEIENIVSAWDEISDEEIYADSDSECEEDGNEILSDVRKEQFTLDCSIASETTVLEDSFNGDATAFEVVVESGPSCSTPRTKKRKIKSDFEWKKVTKTDVCVDAVMHSFNSNPQMKECVAKCEREVDFLKLFFDDEILDLIVKETNLYQKQNDIGMKKKSNVRSHHKSWTDLDKRELMTFLSLTLLCGHVEKDKIAEYWSMKEEIETPYFKKIMSLDRFKLILSCLHFADNSAAPQKTNPDYDRLWKMRNLFDKLVNNFKSCYEPRSNLVIDEVIVTFKGRVVFRQYIPKKHKRWGIKVYKLCDESAYTYDMKVYLGKDRDECLEGQSAAETVVLKLIESVRGKGHNLFIDNFFTSPKLFVKLRDEYRTNTCGTVRKNRKDMPENLAPKKKGDINAMWAKGLISVCWKDKRDVFVLSSMHAPTGNTLENVSDELKKPGIINSYNKNMGFVDLSDRMANSYGFSRKTMKWPIKLFFHFLNIAVLNAYILFKMKLNLSQTDNISGSVKKIDHKTFRLNLIRQIIEMNCDSASVSRQVRVSDASAGHWPEKSAKRRRCVQCHKNKKETKTWIQCKSCGVGLCIGTCYEDYHIK